jgi:hypothetical protein
MVTFAVLQMRAGRSSARPLPCAKPDVRGGYPAGVPDGYYADALARAGPYIRPTERGLELAAGGSPRGSGPAST